MRKYVDTFAGDGNHLSLVLISGDADFVADLSGMSSIIHFIPLVWLCILGDS